MQQINDDTGTTRPVKRAVNAIFVANSVINIEAPIEISNAVGVNNNQYDTDLKFA